MTIIIISRRLTDLSFYLADSRVCQNKGEGGRQEKNWYSKRKVTYFLLKAYNQTRNFIKKKSKSINKKFF